jgi:hypothetical protein
MHAWYGNCSKGCVVAGSFAHLASLVRDGQVKIIELQAVPRSMSTALGRCLNESEAASVFINEPFNMNNDDPDIAAGHVIRWVEPALSSMHGPVIVVTKNMARYLPAPVFRAWTDICSVVVWSIRDPRVQISSLVTRTVNDALFGVGADRIKASELLPSHFEMVTRLLQNSEWSTDFSKTGWRAIGAHFTGFDESRSSLVADGTLFSRVPDRFLRYLCSGLGIEFRDRMISGWREPFLNVDRLDNPGLADSSDAWIKHAATSRGIEAAAEHVSLQESNLPPALRDHLLEVALPTYEMLMGEFHSRIHQCQDSFGLGSRGTSLGRDDAP